MSDYESIIIIVKGDNNITIDPFNNPPYKMRDDNIDYDISVKENIRNTKCYNISVKSNVMISIQDNSEEIYKLNRVDDNWYEGSHYNTYNDESESVDMHSVRINNRTINVFIENHGDSMILHDENGYIFYNQGTIEETVGEVTENVHYVIEMMNEFYDEWKSLCNNVGCNL